MPQPQQPPSPTATGSRIRLIALSGAVVLAVALPLAAAVAGPSSPTSPSSDAARSPRPSPAPSSTRPLLAAGGPEAPHGHHEPGKGDAGKNGADPGELLSDVGSQLPDGVAGDGRPVTSCGPELTAPQGVQAQTCVLSEGGRTWARAYYRNATDDPLHAVLTLMRPDGHTLQAYCELPVSGGPGTCETPRRTTVGGGVLSPDKGKPGYSAVLEIADRDQEKMLLRVGSNSKSAGNGGGAGSNAVNHRQR
ncbi:hypothetical protein [Streptomyces sp. ODS28]|uniref:hypothetical protein n=1 Tax=Streptomyces sp. ODS28 TaxID=3136688 RepID=UPI0031EF55BB